MADREEQRPIIVDTDGGIDDALALMMLAAHDRPPSLITTSFGNVDLEQATDNILDTLAVLDLDCPVHAGAARSLAGDRVDAVEIHGEDGLGGAARPSRHTAAQSENAISILCDTLKSAAANGSPLDLLMLGPLTNLALAIALDRTLIPGIGQLYIMGGTCFGRGNITPAAEFNVYADPEAAAVVLSAVPGAILIPWEPCVDNPIPGAKVDAFFETTGDGATGDFMKALCDQGRMVHRRFHQKDALVLPDPLAAAVVLDRSIVTRSRRCPVLVECAGQHTRGATIPISIKRDLFENPDVELIEMIDARRLEKMFETTVLRIASA